MLVTSQEAAEKLNSPLNLLNRLRSSSPKNSAMGLFGINSASQSREQIKNITPARPENPPVRNFNPFPSVSTELQVTQEVIREIEKQPDLETIVPNAEDQVSLALAHDNALKTLNSAVERLNLEIDNIKPDKLPSVIAATSKVVESIRKERLELTKNSGNRTVHLHFYTPEQRSLESYKVIDV